MNNKTRSVKTVTWKIKVSKFFKLIYLKLLRINDSPQKIALGFGLGVFVGVMPGTGPIAALVCAFIFRANRASALLGSLITNTWLSLIFLLLSIKTGSFLLRLNPEVVAGDWQTFIKHFSWAQLFQASARSIVIPIAIGYFFISLYAGILAYAIVYFYVTNKRKRQQRIKA
jgi:uncharacterized protein